MKIHAFRLKPGDDLKKEIQNYVTAHNISAGAMLTCVGSLTAYRLRMAGATFLKTESGKFEIVSLVGTLSGNGSHLHLSLSDTEGIVTGGHLTEGCLINTTAEIVLCELPGFNFERVRDPQTGYQELVITS